MSAETAKNTAQSSPAPGPWVPSARADEPQATGSSPSVRPPAGPVVATVSLAAIVVSAALLFVNLHTKPFWVDEAIAVLPAQSILTEGVPRNPFDLDFIAFQLEDRIWDPSAPLYRYAIAAVAAGFGFSETTTRAFSVVFALLSLLPCYWLFARLDGGRTALVAVALLAASPHFAETAREARHFAFVGCMMAFTFYFLTEASQGSERGKAWWPVFLTATLLGHAIGYLAVPVVLTFVAVAWKRPLLSRRYAAGYGLLLAVYAAIQAKYWNTLPFLHAIGCHNHHAGCHPNPLYYFWLLHAYLTGAPIEPTPGLVTPPLAATAVSAVVPVALLLIGFVATVAALRRPGPSRPSQLLLVAWFLLPLVLLSTRDVKFPRYLVYVMAPMWLFVARGLVAVTARWAPGRLREPVLAGAAVILMLAPLFSLERTADGRRLRVESRYLARAFTSLHGEMDHWERMRAQVVFLRTNLRPGDAVVSSLDDASLGYYLGHFVYGFLNSQRRDAFFMNLLDETSRRGARVWFVDTLPEHNYCHTPGAEPYEIDCRVKYRRFYDACRPGSGTSDPACVRLRFD